MDSEPTTHETHEKSVHPEKPAAKVGRWLKPLAATLGGVALVAVISVALHKTKEHGEAQKVAVLEGQWAALEGCLLGPELTHDESPATRFRAIQLTVVGTRHDARKAAHEGAWPARCESFASGVASHANAAHDKGQDLVTSASALARELGADTNATAELDRLVTQVWKDASSAGLSAKPANPADAPHPTRPLVNGTAFRAEAGFRGDFSLASVKVDPDPTANTRFLIDDRHLEGGPVVCAVSGTPATLSCLNVGGQAAATAGLTLFGTTEANAHPWVFAGDRGQLGIYRPSGTIALQGYAAAGAAGLADGSAWLLVHSPGTNPTDLRMVQAPVTGDVPSPSPVVGIEAIEHPDDATLAWDWLVLLAAGNSQWPHHLVAHKLVGNGAVGPAVDIGDAANVDYPGLADGTQRFTACRSGSHTAIRIHGAHTDAVTFFTGVAWTAPVALHTLGGALVCEDNEVVVTTPGPSPAAPEVFQSRCNAAGCTQSHLAAKDLFTDTDVAPQDKDSFAAAELAGKLAVVWNSGPMGGLRMRFAPMDALKSTQDSVIYDPRADNGTTVMNDLRLLSGPDAALLFVKTRDSAHIISIDREGRVTVPHTGP